MAAASLAYAIGISPADAYINFVPNYEYVIDYSVASYRPFEFYVEGPFSEYTKIETLHHSDTQGNFRVHLALPEDYEPPGKHRLYVAAKEKPSEGTVNTIAGIRGFIEIDVPFPGFYAEMELYVDDVNAGEPVPMSAVIRNKGTLNISDARVVLEILDDVRSVKTIRSDSVGIETGGAYDFKTTIPGNELKPGRYVLKAVLYYEGRTKEKTADFRVGAFDVAIVNYTDTMFNGSVNLFEIEVESLWNNRIDTVYMDLSMIDSGKSISTVKTPPFDLPAWGKKRSSLYWNTEGIPVGKYDLEIVLHYDEGVRTENRKIYIVAPPVEEAPIPVSTIILVIIALMLIFFNIYFIFSRRKKEKKEDKEGKGG
ncbi:hypothetical protein JW898_01410 [Candidatus Woesearchaeota archaeon]|nr:hypothetical protein [Candidatus Woesearchaeota archaeon]